MCFSPEVDVVAAEGISVAAVDSLRNARGARSVPLAIVPAVFAVHPLTSAFVWRGRAAR